MKILIIFFGLILISNLGTSQELDSEFLKGETALENGQYKEAIEYFTKAIRHDRQFKLAYLLRSKAYYGTKKYSKAIKDSKKVLDFEPEILSEENYTALWNIAICNNSLGNYNKALIYLEKAKQMKPKNPRLYENSGFSYWGIGDLESAEQEFKKMIELDPQSPKGHYAIGKTAYLNNNFKEAIEAYNIAIKIDPNYALAYQNRGSAKLEIGNLKGCCDDWKKAFELGIYQIESLLKQYCE